MAATAAGSTFDNIEDSLEHSPENQQVQHAYSLHGSKAAYRRAITELLFFASVGGTQFSWLCWRLLVDSELLQRRIIACRCHTVSTYM